MIFSCFHHLINTQFVVTSPQTSRFGRWGKGHSKISKNNSKNEVALLTRTYNNYGSKSTPFPHLCLQITISGSTLYVQLQIYKMHFNSTTLDDQSHRGVTVPPPLVAFDQARKVQTKHINRLEGNFYMSTVSTKCLLIGVVVDDGTKMGWKATTPSISFQKQQHLVYKYFRFFAPIPSVSFSGFWAPLLFCGLIELQ